MKKRRFVPHLPGVCARRMLRVFLPLIALTGVSVLIGYLDARAADVVLANDLGAALLSDYLAVIVLALVLAVLADALELSLAERTRGK